MTSASVLRVLAGESARPPPVWLMRQAGRYLPEYRKLRADFAAGPGRDSFTEFCLSPEVAARAAMQPLERFPDLGAAIVFSDILLVPFALGVAPDFSAGSPRLAPLARAEDVEALVAHYEGRAREVVGQKLGAVGETVRLLKKSLPSEVPLIGFAAAPWTLACYMIQGGGASGFPVAREFLARRLQSYLRLNALLEEYIVALLEMQRDAGADILQLFDSWGGLVPEEHRAEVTFAPIARIAGAVAEWKMPFIVHARGDGESRFDWAGLCERLPASPGFCRAISPDAGTDLSRLLPLIADDIVIQGNLDSRLLTPECSTGELETALGGLAGTLRGRPWICNLGAGLTPDSDPRRVQALIDFVKKIK
ncbi:MAG: uroporphyrinogen decarboxylase [Alphaproteobacteria bacterium]|nr:uroporphyrinogen decarboxylase [Alphaproteobacteria bacterium]